VRRCLVKGLVLRCVTVACLQMATFDEIRQNHSTTFEALDQYGGHTRVQSCGITPGRRIG
jgi:hypothetical protein